MASTLTNLLVHVVFSTKGREPTISIEVKARLNAYIGGIVSNERAQLLAIGGTSDHVHLAMKIRSNQVLCELVRKIKSNSSKWLNDKRFCAQRFAWQNGYGAFSVSPSQIAKVISYIGKQVEHHERKTFEQELIEVLDRHGVKYDPKYLWD
jgi:putative transposase